MLLLLLLLHPDPGHLVCSARPPSVQLPLCTSPFSCSAVQLPFSCSAVHLLALFVHQVLVYHDLLGMMSHPHHAKVTPKFCKRYAEVGQVIQSALAQYRQDVEDGSFPGQQYSPYSIPTDEVDQLVQQLRDSGMHAEADAVAHTTVGVRQPPRQVQQHQQQQHVQDPAAVAPVASGGSTAKVL